MRLTERIFHVILENTGMDLISHSLVGSIDTAALFIQHAMVRGSVRISVPWRSICKYAFASAISAVFFFVLPATGTLLLTLTVVLAGIGIYVSILLAIDKDARHLVRLIYHEIKGVMPHALKNELPA